MRTVKRAFVALGAGARDCRGEPGCAPGGALVEPSDGAAAAAPLHALLDGRRDSACRTDSGPRFPITDGSAVAGGDRIRLAFSTGSDGYAYVVIRDAQGGVSRAATPARRCAAPAGCGAGSVYEAPADGRWFTVDASGRPRRDLPVRRARSAREPRGTGRGTRERSHARGTPRTADVPPLRACSTGSTTAVPRPIRTRTGREIVDGLAPAPPPAAGPPRWRAARRRRARPRPRPAC